MIEIGLNAFSLNFFPLFIQQFLMLRYLTELSEWHTQNLFGKSLSPYF
jgi:hypothetical protein